MGCVHAGSDDISYFTGDTVYFQETPTRLSGPRPPASRTRGVRHAGREPAHQRRGVQDPISQKQEPVHSRHMVTSQKPTAPTARTTTSVSAPHPTPSSRPIFATATQPSEDEIRDYANHLYVQHGSLNGHDRDDWLEAEACLRANIPKESSRSRMHHHTQITERTVLPLVKHGRS